MEMAMVQMDGKGRVLIPKKMRESLKMGVNVVLFVYAFESVVFMRKVSTDNKSVLESVERLGLTALAPSNKSLVYFVIAFCQYLLYTTLSKRQPMESRTKLAL
ncbi:MAG: hypothetical protein JXC85_04455 [Candidatus Aenigmarchaeota archaeon]|nr:hypothetical protein [Candidatus Aenigmarchaeota archaeon]